jgi:hypothetical protein
VSFIAGKAGRAFSLEAISLEKKLVKMNLVMSF